MQNLNNAVVHVESITHESEEFKTFLEAWIENIEDIFPDFSEDDAVFSSICLIKVNAIPSGLFMYQAKGEEAHVEVDFIVPEYRDKGIGKAFFRETLTTFKSNGFERIVISTENQVHIDYIKESGFEQSKLQHSRFELLLSKALA